MPSYKFSYFDVKARGELARLLMVVGDQKFEDHRIQFADWPQLKEKFPFGVLPVLEVKNDDGSTFLLSQSLTICRYLAKKFNFLGNTLEDAAEIEMFTDQLNDVMSVFFDYFLENDSAKKEELKKKLIGDLLPKNLKYVEDKLKSTNSGFIVGKSLTMVDLMLLVFIQNLVFVGLEFSLDQHPNVQACVEKVKSNEKIAEWIKSHP